MEKNCKIFGLTENIKDFRQQGKIIHPLENIILLTIAAVISGVDTWELIEDFGKCKKPWLEKFLNLENGIPSHDTISRFFQLLKPKEFQEAFLLWINAIIENKKGDFIAIDGKTLRRSYNKKDNKAAIHMVSAWSNMNSCVLGQLKTEEKSNEITAIPELLKILNIENSIVTIDAMGTQKKIASDIKKNEGDYILQVKGNQPTLEKDIITFFDSHLNSDSVHFYIEESKKVKHGRFEIRKYYITDDLDTISKKNDWAGIQSIAMTEATRIVNGKISVNKKYYISSITPNVKLFAEASRKHWSIENKLHWSLDVTFKEDNSRVRTGFAAENFASIRHIALNILKQDKSLKMSIPRKRMNCAMKVDFLEKVIKL